MSFNILLVGPSQSGKTLFLMNFIKKLKQSFDGSFHDQINESFCQSVYGDQIDEDSIYTGDKTCLFESYVIKNLDCNNFLYNFTLTDSPGYQKPSGEWAEDVLHYIERCVSQ